MKLPAEIQEKIEVPIEQWALGGNMSALLEAVVRIVAEDCAAVADDTETVEVRGYDAQLGDAEATKDKIIEAIRQRYGLDENNSEALVRRLAR